MVNLVVVPMLLVAGLAVWWLALAPRQQPQALSAR
jgi:hypothetical protein